MKNENLENQIKNQLEQRSIKPSHDAWQKLESALDDQGIGEGKNRKKLDREGRFFKFEMWYGHRYPFVKYFWIY